MRSLILLKIALIATAIVGFIGGCAKSGDFGYLLGDDTNTNSGGEHTQNSGETNSTTKVGPENCEGCALEEGNQPLCIAANTENNSLDPNNECRKCTGKDTWINLDTSYSCQTDNDPCTDDICEAGVCSHPPKCGQLLCDDDGNCCNGQAGYGCHEGNVYNIDACGRRTTLDTECKANENRTCESSGGGSAQCVECPEGHSVDQSDYSCKICGEGSYFDETDSICKTCTCSKVDGDFCCDGCLAVTKNVEEYCGNPDKLGDLTLIGQCNSDGQCDNLTNYCELKGGCLGTGAALPTGYSFPEQCWDANTKLSSCPSETEINIEDGCFFNPYIPFCGQDAEYPDNYGDHSEATRFDASDPEVFVDQLTKLTWQKGYAEAGTTTEYATSATVGKYKAVNDPSPQNSYPGTNYWYGAKEYCANHPDNATATNKWRLPTRRELNSLLDQGTTGPAVPDAIKTFVPNARFWSSTRNTSHNYHAWCIHFFNGYMNILEKNGDYSARCVRGQN